MDSIQLGRLRRLIITAAFAAWIATWLFLIARELFLKDNISGYKELLARSLEGKRSYVTGDRLYQFLTFAKVNLPASATYGFLGIEDGSLDQRRAVYYLYPLIENSKPEYLLVFDANEVLPAGYAAFRNLDADRYIVKRLEGRR